MTQLAGTPFGIGTPTIYPVPPSPWGFSPYASQGSGVQIAQLLQLVPQQLQQLIQLGPQQFYQLQQPWQPFATSAPLGFGLVPQAFGQPPSQVM